MTLLPGDTLCEIFQDTALRYADKPALRSSDGSIAVTWHEYADRVRRIAGNLAGLGVGRGDTVALMLTNRPEFHLIDMACVHLGAIPFSIYNTSSAEQIAYLLSNAESRLVICERQFEELVIHAAEGAAVERVLVLEDGFDELLEEPAPGFDFEGTWRGVVPEDVLTLIYTSGTTGPPKGVELTHANVLFSVRVALDIPRVAEAAVDGLVISYLPDAHLANRWFAHYIPAATGAETVTLANMKQIAATLAAERPTAFLGVPTIWYKLRAAIESALAEEPGVRGALARWAVEVGKKRVRAELEAGKVPAALTVQHAVADRLVLSKLRSRMGVDRLIAPVTGAAPVAVEALEFVLALGIPLVEGWGMSETCTVGTVVPFDDIRPGTVGRAFPGIELRIADDGELLLRSPGVMRGYRNDPDKTAEAIDPDGWLHTGDIATIDDDGFVRIVDRKKEIIINAAGKNMSPANIEGALNVESGLIGSVVAIGDRRPYVAALVTLDPDAVTASRLDAEGARKEIAAAVERANAKLARVEQIKKFAVLPDAWSPGGDELTPTLKLKRKPISEKYAAEIDEMYR